MHNIIGGCTMKPDADIGGANGLSGIKHTKKPYLGRLCIMRSRKKAENGETKNKRQDKTG